MVSMFQKTHAKRIAHAAAFSRMTEQEKADVIALAEQYKGSKNTLAEIAAEIAAKSSRGHETIRSTLHNSAEIIRMHGAPKPLTRNQVRAIEQEIRKGASWKSLERKHHRTAGAMRKAIARLRRTSLKQLDFTFVDLEIFQREDAEDVILASPVALEVSPPVLSLTSLENNSAESHCDEVPIISAMHLLRKRAARSISQLPYVPSMKKLDRIETDLRWSYALQQHLILQALPSSFAVAVQHAGRPLTELPAQTLTLLLSHVLQVVGDSCASLDPSTGQSALRTPASIVDRAIPLLDSFSKPSRAAASSNNINVPYPFYSAVPWSYLLPKEHVYEKAMRQSEELGKLVGMRYGWIGKPSTYEEIANHLHSTPNKVARMLKRWT